MTNHTITELGEEFLAQLEIIPTKDDDYTAADLISQAQALFDKSIVDTTQVSFDEMLYLPFYHKWMLDSYDTVFIDEAQDLAPIQHWLVKQLATRIIAVGDPRQAIYAFRGADSNSMQTLRDSLRDPATLKLTTCFRCPVSVIHEANTIVKDFYPWEGAEQGTISSLDYENFLDLSPTLNYDHLILCRNRCWTKSAPRKAS